MNQIILITTYPKDEYDFYRNAIIAASCNKLKMIDEIDDFIVVADNKEGLPAVYNRHINQYANTDRILVFLA